MKPRVYLETTIASYLTARPSRDIVSAAHQELTIEWWSEHRTRFDLFVSQLVLDESSQGDNDAATRRLTALAGISILSTTDESRVLAQRFLELGLIPAKAIEDAIHVAIATTQGMDYLLTWNCTHIANAGVVRGLVRACERLGYEMPTLCAPEQLMGN